MTDKNLTEIVAIIDRSGSMSSLQTETIGGFNNFVNEQKKGSGKAVLTLVQFDNQYQIDYQGVDVNDVKPLDESTYVPRGMTALLDAVGRTVNAVGDRLAKTEEEKRPSQIIFLVITDGQENASQEFKAEKVKEMVKHQIDKYNWSFVYLGGGDIESQREQGQSIGIGAGNVYNFTADSRAVDAVYENVSKGVSRRRDVLFAAGAPAAAAASLLDDDEVKDLITSK